MSALKVLVAGSGGREHALCWALARSPSVGSIACVPGNPGIESIAECLPVKAEDIAGILECARRVRPDIVVVGPEAPLAAGLADTLRAAGFPVFGPQAAGARIESSKAFAKELMADAGVPTARHRVVRSVDEAERAIDELGGVAVVKADGLAAGKGVVVATDQRSTLEAAKRFLVDGSLGEAGRTVVIEEKLEGPELSVIGVTDGAHVRVLPTAQDHKRLRDDDQGPNTGGMGAYAPADSRAGGMEEIVQDVFKPVLTALRSRGIEYRGALYAGLMMTTAGPRVLEFNCRFGDPETQVILPLLDEDLGDLFLAAASAEISDRPVRTKPAAAVCVVVASEGYPDSPMTGRPLRGLFEAEAVPGVVVFHAGTRRAEDQIVSSGGRVIGVTAVASDLKTARETAYRATQMIHLEGAQFRRDIAARAFAAATRQG